MAKRTKRPSDVAEWMEEQYRKNPELREQVESEVAAMELAMGLTRMREDLGVSQAQLAKRIGISQPAIAKIEAGKAKGVRLTTLKLYTRALGGDIKVQLVKGSKNVLPMRRRAATG